MKLWLDDTRPMPDGFDVHARNYEEAIAYLDTGKITCISFDFVLSKHVGVATGLDVARYILEKAKVHKIPFMAWAVHSDSWWGREKITQVMQETDNNWPDYIEMLEDF